jgi:hypothetical protein
MNSEDMTNEKRSQLGRYRREVPQSMELPERVAFFEHLVARMVSLYKPPSELTVAKPFGLALLAAQYWTLAVETASRAIDHDALSDDALLHDAFRIVANPAPAALAAVFFAWRAKHLQIPATTILEAPKFIITCRFNFDVAILRLARRRSLIPLADKFLALNTPEGDPQAFFKDLAATLRRTVKRKLIPTNDDWWDPAQTAIAGTLEGHERGMERLFAKLQEEELLPLPPPVPILGMTERCESERNWTEIVTNVMQKFFVLLAPVFGGVLELALPNAAHEAQRRERDLLSAKMRGGAGGSHAKKAGTGEQEVTHVNWDKVSDTEMLDTDGAEPECRTPEEGIGEREFGKRLAEILPATAALYFQARILGDKSQKEAARIAGIDPRTAREYEQRYEDELRSLVSIGSVR